MINNLEVCKMGRDYYLGLDMGTNSVGWAVTDENYKLLRAKGKDLWGIREFDEASTAVDRRTHRTSRRRRQRQVVRIGLLKDYFHDAITSKDPCFYQRLDNSKFFLEDKDIEVRNINGIFNNPDFSDKDYFSKYPTIFHLRMELINNTSEHDPRLVYLAILQMFKHRGHFLNASLGSESNDKDFDSLFRDFVNLFSDITGNAFTDKIDANEIKNILSKRSLSRTGKCEQISEKLSVTKKDKPQMECIKAICGLSVDGRNIFSDLEDEKEKIEICFSKSDYEEKIPDIISAIGEDDYSVIEIMKSIYDIGSLAEIMKGKKYLSEARVEDYEKHKKDLRILKTIVKKYKSKDFENTFKSNADGSYSAYVNSNNSGKKQRRNMKGRKKEDFYKTVKLLVKDMPDNDENVQYVKAELERDTFMPKQMSASNGVIPNQVHLMEMKKILSNAEAYLPFLSEKDESGLTTSQRIIKLFTFQIPYFVGPVSENSRRDGGNGWVVRKEQGEVLPWNLEQKIDLRKTSEQFIERLVRKCTYISDESVLPKASILYQKFCVLNEINDIKIDNTDISVELKKEIYNSLFLTGKSVSKKRIAKFLQLKGLLTDEAQLSGIDIKVNRTMATYAKFSTVFGEKIKEDKYLEMAENIVFWCTVYGDDKNFLRQQLNEKYSSVFDEEAIKKIIGFKFKDWGKLSKEIIELPGCDKSIGEEVPLIRSMWNTNYNFMELLNSDEFSYKEELADKQCKGTEVLSSFKPEDLDEYYFSAPVKRMVWQTILIIKELEKVLGNAPSRLFVEMTRDHSDDKRRTISRKQKFLDLYRNEKKDEHNWAEVIENADSNGSIRSKKMYLYLTQKGRCMYTGHTIELDKLFDDNLYDIDHIYPRHFVKDDNIDNNLVLVEKEKNAHKSDVYPLENSIRTDNLNTWKALFDKGFINQEKFKRLTGRNEFTDEQQAGFIARQLVETSQGTKGVVDILKEILPTESKIVYSKASNVSEFRNKFDIPKSRIVNDFHHAHDAYLNIVVGNVYFTKFTQNPRNFIDNEYRKDATKNNYNLSKMFDWNVERAGYTAWVSQTDKNTDAESKDAGTIKTVRQMLKKNTPLLTRLTFVNHGSISDATVYGAGKAKNVGYLPLKTLDDRLSDVTKYGGVTNISSAYFFLVEYEEKGKKVRTFETVPVYLVNKIRNDEDALTDYCKNNLHMDKPSVRIPEIKIASLLKVDGYFVQITGKTGKQICLRNVVSLCVSRDEITYIKKLENVITKGFIEKEITPDKNVVLYQILCDKHNSGVYSNRPNPVGEKLRKGIDKFISLEVEEQVTVLLQMLNLTGIVAGGKADLTLIDESKATGLMLIPMKITKFNEIKLINQSVTGLYSTVIDLKTV